MRQSHTTLSVLTFLTAAVLLAVGCGDRACASLVQWSFEGIVTGSIGVDVPMIDDVVRGVVSFDDAVPDADNRPFIGIYDQTGFGNVLISSGGTVVVGQPFLVQNDGPSLSIIDGEPGIGQDDIVLIVYARMFSGGVLTATQAKFNLDLHNFDGTMIDSDRIPTVPPELDALMTSYTSVYDAASGREFRADRITAVSSNIPPGFSPQNPILPGSGDGTPQNPWRFPNTPSGNWSDPPFTGGFEYAMQSNSLFTAILGFPDGFSQSFDVAVDGVSLGQFGPGDWLDFSAFPGGGVERFTITGIDPLVDLENPRGFPLQLLFNTSSADFTMTAVPEPAALGLVSFTLLVVAAQLRRCRQLPHPIT